MRPIHLDLLRETVAADLAPTKEQMRRREPPIREAFSKSEDVPDEWTATLAANQMECLIEMSDHWQTKTAVPVALVSRLSPETLYWEGKWVKALSSESWTPELPFKRMLLPRYETCAPARQPRISTPRQAETTPARVIAARSTKSAAGNS